MMEKILSIIIPVYNVRKYLPRCLKSVIDQWETYSECVEIILVDDGSNDGSEQICDYYSNKFCQIKVIHKKNGGLSEARNVGIISACGEFLLFLDSDDQLAPYALSILIAKIKAKPDLNLFIGRYYELHNEQLKECNYKFNQQIMAGGENLLGYLLELAFPYNWYAWLNIVRKSYLLERNLFFKEGYYFEDMLWTPELLYYSGSVSLINYPFYIYTTDRRDSITNSFSKKKYFDRKYACNHMMSLKSKLSMSDRVTRILWGNLSLVYNSLLSDIWLLRDNERNSLWKDLRDMSAILKCSKRKIDQMMYVASRIIGLKNLSRLLYIRKRLMTDK